MPSGKNIYDIISDLLQVTPKIIKILIVLILLSVGLLYFYQSQFKINNINNKSKNCIKYVIQGKLIWIKSKLPVDNAYIELENGNTFISDEYLEDGKFRLRNIELVDPDYLTISIYSNNNSLLQNKTLRVQNSNINFEKCIIDVGVVYINNSSVLIDDKKNHKSSEDKNSSNEMENTFKFSSKYDHPNIVNKYQHIGELNYNKNSSNLVDFSFSSKIIEFETGSNLYYYPGGHLQLFYEDNICQDMTGILIPATMLPGNQYEYVQNKIDTVIRSILKDKFFIISSNIDKCIN